MMRKVLLITVMMFTLFKLTSEKDIKIQLKGVNSNGISIYKINLDSISFKKRKVSNCSNCLKINKEDLKKIPLLTENEIEEFDYENQQIKLTDKGKKIVYDLEIPLSGLPVALTLDDQIIYGFWFWNAVSSFGCDRVYTYPKVDFKIQFGLPQNYYFGKDPRFNDQLKTYLESKK